MGLSNLVVFLIKTLKYSVHWSIIFCLKNTRWDIKSILNNLRSDIMHLNRWSLHTGTFRCLDPAAVFIFRKSTFFNVLTKSQAAAENFPFCTIDPNESRVPIPDERYDFLCQFHKPARYGVSFSFSYYSHFRSVVADGLLAIGMRNHITMLLTCGCVACCGRR